MTTSIPDCDVAIIGAGPAGAAAAARLSQLGQHVHVIERSHFPRFSIGESLLPQSMAYLDAAGLLDTVQAAGYQPKNGAAFTRRERTTTIDFRDKTTPGWGTTYQVERADFDQRLIRAAEAHGATLEFGTTVSAFDADPERPTLQLDDEHGRTRRLSARFVLDASGYGRVLARLESLERDPRAEPRMAIFSHVADGIDDTAFDREKILIGVHPEDPGIWLWLIPFAAGRASVGVVGDIDALTARGDTPEARWRTLIDQEPRFRHLLRHARRLRDIEEIRGYAASVTRLHGPGYALLGNAGEFLDPVFSSGITIALHSAHLAAPLVDRQLRGGKVDWEDEFETPLRSGVETFRAFVEAWYAGTLQTIVFHETPPPRFKRWISAVLAGYAWDRENPFVSASRRRLATLAELCGHRDEARS